MLKSRTNSASTGESRGAAILKADGDVDTLLLEGGVGEFWNLELVRFGLSEEGIQVSWL